MSILFKIKNCNHIMDNFEERSSKIGTWESCYIFLYGKTPSPKEFDNMQYLSSVPRIREAVLMADQYKRNERVQRYKSTFNSI